MSVKQSVPLMPLLHIVVDARIEALSAIRDQVIAAAEGHDVASQIIQRLDLVLEEAVLNIAKHGYAGQGGALEITLSAMDAGNVALTLEDQGRAFDPTAAATPDLESSLEDRAIGGLGIHFMMAMTDKITYRLENSKNILTMHFCMRDV